MHPFQTCAFDGIRTLNSSDRIQVRASTRAVERRDRSRRVQGPAALVPENTLDAAAVSALRALKVAQAAEKLDEGRHTALSVTEKADVPILH